MTTAAYARYSTDMQSSASLDDQLRNVRTWCARNGHAEPVCYTDAAISGTRDDRPGYRRLRADISAGRYDLLVVDDLSRLTRDSAELGQFIKRLRFAGVRLVGVSDGVDTARRGHKIEVGLRGLMSELYVDDLAEKTHRGLTGRALAGKSAGGLPYGYRITATGERAIHPEQAEIVRRIYRMTADGHSPRSIAAALNRDGIPSPRGRAWYVSAIYGDQRRGIGILGNPIYAGQQVWNRSRWSKHPETSLRTRTERPESEWIITQHPDLAIIDSDTWATVRDVLAGRAHAQHKSGGPQSKHLLSGILRCAVCGGPLTAVNATRYGCSRAKNSGHTACTSRLLVPIKNAESAILAGIQRDLLSDAAQREYERTLRQIVAECAPDTRAAENALRSAERERDNILAALRAGIYTASTRAELQRCESAVAAAQDKITQARSYQPAQIIPRARELWRRAIEDLSTLRSIPTARTAIRQLVGDHITVHEATTQNARAEISAGVMSISMVAGACYGQYLRPISIEIPLRKGRAS